MSKATSLCRVCNGPLCADPLLQYENSPNSAQGFLSDLIDKNDSIDLKIYQCLNCGLVQHNHAAVEYYKEVIRSVAFSREMSKFRIAQLSDWIVRNDLTNKRILEVGCGKGEYLDLLKLAGAKKIAGIEYSQKNLPTVAEKGYELYSGYLDSDFQHLDDFKFDAFAIFSFLEHWPDPNSSLAVLRESLSEAAVGLVEVPNFELILEKGLYSEFTVDHIFYFNKKTLAFLLEKNGFEVLSMNKIWYDYIISAEIRKRPLLDIAKFIRIQDQIKFQLAEYFKKFTRESVAIWGAGHQALAVIAMANISRDIKYIVDSAPFKQGKYTPATHIPIVSPDHMLINRPESVIVMAAGFSNEVVQILNNKYPFVKNIAVLRGDELECIA